MKRNLLISISIIVLVLVLMFIGAWSSTWGAMSEQERQGYLEQARQYDLKAATAWDLSREMSQRAKWTWSEWMNTDQREDYAKYSKGASYQWELYYKYTEEANRLRQLAQSK